MGDIQRFHTGDSDDCYKFLGSHREIRNGVSGVRFSVWAPHADSVQVVGDFNKWGIASFVASEIPKKMIQEGSGGALTYVTEPMALPLMKRGGAKNGWMKRGRTGIWSVFLPDIEEGTLYKYKVITRSGHVCYHADPMAIYSELRPGTASIVYHLQDYPWTDRRWMTHRAKTNYSCSPLNIYEIHLGSWRRGTIPGLTPAEQEAKKGDAPFLNYREIADLLVPYLQSMHYTHVEVMPITEHPLDASWGYQTSCFYSITSRYGTPDDFRYFVNRLHEAGLGVILDWVPGHFCKDEAGLFCFDGTWLYEEESSLRRENEWGTANFALWKGEVQSFLISNALYFFREFHIDGLRVDAVANMLYLNYGKQDCPELRNQYGGVENIDAIEFFRKLNRTVYRHVVNPLMIAEDSTTWPLVTKPDFIGGLGFTFKWNIGWMNDTLEYMRKDPIYRKWEHNRMTFSLVYAFSENFILPLSHDEVVHGKLSLLNKMYGDADYKFTSLRCYYTYMMTHPGKKLLFMGGEFGQFIEWRYSEELEWSLLFSSSHAALRDFVSELNYLYKKEKSLWEQDDRYDGFEWIDAHNGDQSVFSYLRKGKDPKDFLVVVCNFTPVSYDEYNIGVPRFADYEEILNSDAERFGGSGMCNEVLLRPHPTGWHGKPFCVTIKLPAGSAVILKPHFPKRKNADIHETGKLMVMKQKAGKPTATIDE